MMDVWRDREYKALSGCCKTSHSFLDSPSILVTRQRCVPQSRLAWVTGWVVKFISHVVLELKPPLVTRCRPNPARIRRRSMAVRLLFLRLR